MKIKSLVLFNYRNHLKLNMKLDDNINVIYGSNGMGKTNIIESIYFVSYLNSYRANKFNEVINFDSNFAKIHLTSDSIYEVIISNNKKKCLLNNRVIPKQSDFIGVFKSVLFSPETIDILLKSPSQRRKYIDIFICMIDNTYIHVIKEFHYILKQRNEYLRQMMINSLTDKKYFDILNERYVKTSLIIYRKRKLVIKELNDYAKNIFKEFFDFDLSIKYEVQSKINFDDLESSFINKLEIKFEQELYKGNTLVGPSYDDIIFNINNRNVKFFGSKGQQRVVLISLKLAEIMVISKFTNTAPILILDDVLSELDEKRQNILFDFLSSKDLQTIITTTDYNDIKNNICFNKISLDNINDN
ncbi:MAG: DNA replication/repair protein RecF [Bacilli bacterium]